ncbi:hypothetical protein [Bosea sp. BK604]|uniref:hypothetical protein n=1 Tax=Bosea sp. BK604 TaxID=2512180 RepID=UPI001052D80D|nr:hypothetical protein [Bosea sp. BK604]TCR62281.1 hypothetical protein EV560_111272 [Bosea sp. BK604]
MSMSIQGSAPMPLADALKRGSTLTSKAAETATAEAKFLKYAQMTPAERLHQQMLAKFGVTEEEFQKMDPKAQAELAGKIRDEILKQLNAGGDKRTGMLADIKV